MEDHGSDNVCVRLVGPWRDLMAVASKLTVGLIAGTTSQNSCWLAATVMQRGAYNGMCKNSSMEWHGWYMHDLQVHSLEEMLLHGMIRL